MAQVSSLSSLFSIFFSAICFGFSFNTKPFYKILKIIMWLDLKYTKPHKMFQNYWTYINYIKNIYPMQIVIELIQRPKINVSEIPKILVSILPLANIFRD